MCFSTFGVAEKHNLMLFDVLRVKRKVKREDGACRKLVSIAGGVVCYSWINSITVLLQETKFISGQTCFWVHECIGKGVFGFTS